MADVELSPTGDAGKFYVYIYRDPREGKGRQPLYVGKGSPQHSRAESHWRRGSHNAFFARILAKIRDAGLDPIIEIAGYFDDEAMAFAFEMELIAQFGRRNIGTGCLTNLTDGGEGASGMVPSQRARDASRSRLKNIRAAQWDDPDFRSKALANLAAGRADPVARKKSVAGIVAAKAALAADPVRLAAQNEQRSHLRKIAWENPETRQKYLDGMKVTRTSRSTKMRERWEEPEYRAEHGAKVGAAAKAAWADPETRRKRIEAIRAGRRAKGKSPK